MITVCNQVCCPSRPVKATQFPWSSEVFVNRRFTDMRSRGGFAVGACDALIILCNRLFEIPALLEFYGSVTVQVRG